MIQLRRIAVLHSASISPPTLRVRHILPFAWIVGKACVLDILEKGTTIERSFTQSFGPNRRRNCDEGSRAAEGTSSSACLSWGSIELHEF